MNHPTILDLNPDMARRDGVACRGRGSLELIRMHCMTGSCVEYSLNSAPGNESNTVEGRHLRVKSVYSPRMAVRLHSSTDLGCSPTV